MYYRAVDGELAMEDIESLIRDEELGAARFVESKVAKVRSDVIEGMVNMMKFVELEPGTIPPDLVLVKAGAPVEGRLDWSGLLLVGGSAILVEAYRV